MLRVLVFILVIFLVVIAGSYAYRAVRDTFFDGDTGEEIAREDDFPGVPPTAAPPPQPPRPAPTPTPLPEVQQLSNCDRPPSRDYNRTVPETLVVPDGHLMVASFFYPDQPELVTVLTPGTWSNVNGYTFGVTYDYTNCPQEKVVADAQAHAARRGGEYLGINEAFS